MCSGLEEAELSPPFPFPLPLFFPLFPCVDFCLCGMIGYLHSSGTAQQLHVSLCGMVRWLDICIQQRNRGRMRMVRCLCAAAEQPQQQPQQQQQQQHGTRACTHGTRACTHKAVCSFFVAGTHLPGKQGTEGTSRLFHRSQVCLKLRASRHGWKGWCVKRRICTWFLFFGEKCFSLMMI